MSLFKQIQIAFGVGAIIIGASSYFVSYVAVEQYRIEAKSEILNIYIPN